MLRWERYIHAVKDYLVLFLLLSFSTALISKNDSKQVTWMRAGVAEMVAELQNWASKIYQYRVLKQENELLRQRLAVLSFENSLMKEAYLENDRLRNMLGFKRRSKFDLIPVRIVSRAQQGFSSALLIDMGRRNGLRENMPVLTSDGLLGRIASVSEDFAVVQTIEDVNFRVSAMIQRSRIRGIVAPAENGHLMLQYVPVFSDVKVGDVVITSGVSEIYPKGIEIGIVIRIEAPPNALFKTVELVPSVEVSKQEEAFVVRNKPKNRS